MKKVAIPLCCLLALCLFLSFSMPSAAESVTDDVYSDEATDLPVSVTSGDGQLTVSFPKTVDDETADTIEITIQKTGDPKASTPIVLSSSSYNSDTIKYTINQLTNKTSYSVTVSALKGRTLIAVGSGNGIPVAAVPVKLSGVKSTAGNGQVTISFNKLSGQSPDSYQIDYWTVKNGKKLSLTPITIKAESIKWNTHSYTIKKLKNGTTYYFNVYAKKMNKPVTLSVQVKATPAAPKTKK
jgi:hypothetical protein